MRTARYPTLVLAVLAAILCAACGDDEPTCVQPGPVASSPLVIPDAAVVDFVSWGVLPSEEFAEHAFPPTMPDKTWHQDIWTPEACLECHATGEEDAPIVKHEGMPKLWLEGACRSCHVIRPDED